MADERPIIIKRIKKVAGGHHGGAWKVAYADFVTAMMAFFLLLWLLNAVTEEQKKGIADYFRPTIAVQNTSATFTILQGQAQPIENMSGGASCADSEDDPGAAPITGRRNRPPAKATSRTSPTGNEPQPGQGDKPVDLEEAEATVAAKRRSTSQQIKDEIKKAIEEDRRISRSWRRT